MKRLRNNRGMTLIEVTVVLLISTILLTIVGSILVTSLNFFRDQKISDSNKQKLDGIAEYVDSEINYATDLAVAGTNFLEGKYAELGWHYLSINDGKLYRDGKQVFNDSYYDNYTVNIKVKGYNGYHLDVTYEFNNSKDELVYDTSKAYSFDNLKIKLDFGGEDYLKNISNQVEVSDNNRIYYIKGINIKDPGVDEPGDGADTEKPDGDFTVADQIHCLNTINNRGVFESGRKYQKGDFVYYQGSWWQLVYNDDVYRDETAPGTTAQHWKKIDRNYNCLSAYTEKDVIYYEPNGHYYKCIKDLINLGGDPQYGPTETLGNSHWEDIGISSPTMDSGHDCDELSTINRKLTVMNELDSLIESGQINSIPEYANTVNYPVGSWIYRVIDGRKEYCVKIANGDGEPGSSPNSGWKIMSRDWQKNGAYKNGDIVYYGLNGIEYIKAINDINIENDPNNDVWNNKNWIKLT